MSEKPSRDAKTRDAKPARRVPLARPTFGPEEEALLLETLRSGWVTQGPRVEAFEERFARVVGAEHAVAVSSGTAALFLSLHTLGIGAGDEVVVPSLTYIASVNSIVHVGATPVLVDVDEDSYNVDPAAVASALTSRTRAILVVHQLGLPVDLDALQKLADANGIALIEDSACAMGSSHGGRPVGSSANLGCFSFHPRKVLVTGEGGMITTPDRKLAARLRRLRHQGMSTSDHERHRADRVITERYEEVGYNLRMSDLHAAVGIAQLEKLDTFVSARRARGAYYNAQLAALPQVAVRGCPAYALPNYQSYVLRIPGIDRETRDRVLDSLHARGVATRRGLMAVHREAAYRGARLGGSLSVSEQLDDQTLLLPMYNDLSQDDQDFVLDRFREVLDEWVPRDGARS